MIGGTPGPAIPREAAVRLCAEIRAEQRGRWWRPAAWRCAWCSDLSRGDAALRRYALGVANRGCAGVTYRWERSGRPPR